jgi:hypothetical protein
MAEIPMGNRIEVEIWTDGQRIEGKVFVPQEVRLSDSLNDEAQRFLSMTEVKIRSLDANVLLWDGTYLAVNKAAINVVRLIGDNDQDRPTFAIGEIQ